MTQEEARLVGDEWFAHARAAQYPLTEPSGTWLVMGGRGSGKTRLGAEWVHGLVHGFAPFASRGFMHIALIGETLGDVREVMIDGPSGISTIARGERPRYEPTRRRLLWDNGATAHVFSSEDPDSLRGPQFEAAWCDELGGPAVDKGPNQPNVFPDPKSSEGTTPHFSNGGRSDLAQRNLLDAHYRHWTPGEAGFIAANNPVSPINGRRMLDLDRVYLWAWDCRPFPAFPLQTAEWSDGANWVAGHWLNGRLAGLSIGELINAILADHGLAAADVSAVDGAAAGYVISEPSTARRALEELAEVFGLAFREESSGLVAEGPRVARLPVSIDVVAAEEEGPVRLWTQEPAQDLEGEAVLFFRDPFRDFQSATVLHALGRAGGARQAAIGFSGALDVGTGDVLVRDWLRRRRSSLRRIGFSLPAAQRDLMPGSLVRLTGFDAERTYRVEEIDEGLVRRVSARSIDRSTPARVAAPTGGPDVLPPALPSRPDIHFLDLPNWGDTDTPHTQFRIAAWTRPWRRQAAYCSPEQSGYALRTGIERAATLGYLQEPTGGTCSGRIDRCEAIVVALSGGELSSISTAQLLNGANAAAVRSISGAWEIIQFQAAEETAPDVWRLTGLLRGQLGTENEMRVGAEAGAPFVLLDASVQPAGLQVNEAGLELNWRVGPSAAELYSDLFVVEAVKGGLRAARPLSPVHLRAVSAANGDVGLNWIRRSRVAADAWLEGDIPLGEESETYRVEIRAGDGALKRSVDVGTNAWVYPASAIAADFPSRPAQAQFCVSQMSARVGPGISATLDAVIE